MQDNRSKLDGPVLSVPLPNQAPTKDRAVWTKSIGSEQESSDFARIFTDKIVPWLEMGDKLMNQINYAMLTASAMAKNKSDKSGNMLERIRPIIALKEVIDLEVTRRSADLLERLEKRTLESVTCLNHKDSRGKYTLTKVGNTHRL